MWSEGDRAFQAPVKGKSPKMGRLMICVQGTEWRSKGGKAGNEARKARKTKKSEKWTSLVVWWLRICLPMQGMRV